MDTREILFNESSVHSYTGRKFEEYFLGSGRHFSFSGMSDASIPQAFDIPDLPASDLFLLEANDVFRYVKEYCDKHYDRFSSRSFWDFLTHTSGRLDTVLKGNSTPPLSEVKKRLGYIADDTLSLRDRQRIAKELQIHDVPGTDAFARSIQTYQALQDKLNENSSNLSESISMKDLAIWRLDDGVYKEYRGGTFIHGRENIEGFDAVVHFLFAQGDLQLTDEGRRIRLNTSLKNPNLVQLCKNFVVKWNWEQKRRATDEIVFNELSAAAERLSLHEYILREKESKEEFLKRLESGKKGILPFLHDDNADKNIGYILMLRLVLTEGTRSYLSESGLLAKEYRESANFSHPDKRGIYANEPWVIEENQKVNNAYNVLKDKDKFAKWKSGVPMEQIR